jgi:23S rRNA pseudouridine1911/1915/1917 synthase
MPSEPLVFQVAPEEAETRLDHILAARRPDLSRNRIQRALDAGHATVDGRERPSRYRPRVGSEIVFRPPVAEVVDAVPQDIPLTVIYEDADLAVLDKPAGMVCHPAPGHPDGTLVNALLHRYRGLPGEPVRAGLVHRLDRFTTGLLVVARTEAAHRDLSEQLRNRRLGRRYSALSWGQWDESTGRLEGALGRHPHQRLKMAVLERGGRPAFTRYEVVEDFGFMQYCDVELETGRTHQIRVHFAHWHHPVVGDPLYGDDQRAVQVHPLDMQVARAVTRVADRQLLHASALRLRHPVSGEELSFASPLPGDFADCLRLLRDHAGHPGATP